MSESTDARRRPDRVVVVGAGIVGLSCAWSLLQHDVEVEVVDRQQPGAGASQGNAGYLSPALTVPMPEPALLRFGVRAVLDRHSPVHLPLRGDAQRARFLAGLVRHCTTARWRRAMAVFRDLNGDIFAAFDAQRAGGVHAETTDADLVAGFRSPGEAAGLLHELQAVAASGQHVEVDLLGGDEARAAEPHLSRQVTCGLRVRGQRYLTPAAYVAALADAVRSRGGKITELTAVTGVERSWDGVTVRTDGTALDADAAVLANGAWLTPLARPHGVRVPVQAGRGYSCTVPCDEPLRGPLYLPAVRVAIAPHGRRARVTGMMQFDRADAPLDTRFLDTIVRSVRPLVDGLDLDDRQDDWVGGRPLTPDGLPLVGATRTPGVHVAGGHGMWGVTLGPLTGQLLAQQIVTGRTPAQLRPLDPCR